MHILKSSDLTKEYCDKLFLKAWSFANNGTLLNVLSGRIVGTLFFEPSTRTRWSFEAAALKLGGQLLSMENAATSSSGKKGESLADTLKTCSNYCDLLIVRHPEDDAIEEAAQYATVPVINAGSGKKEHPTQGLIDLWTILQNCGTYDNGYKLKNDLDILFTGDVSCSRTCNSLINLLAIYGLEKISLHSEGIAYLTSFRKSVYHYYGDQIYSRLPHIDVLYMTRHQAEREGNREKSKFIITHEFAEVMKRNAIIMHPFPRNEEIHPSTDKNIRAVYFNQIENGLWIRMALLADLIGIKVS